MFFDNRNLPPIIIGIAFGYGNFAYSGDTILFFSDSNENL